MYGDNDVEDLIESVLERPSVFRSKEKLDPDYDPPKLPHREEQLKQLALHFRSLITDPGSVSHRALIVGNIGVGKSVTARRFVKDFTTVAAKKGITVKMVYINCHTVRTLHSVVKNIAAQLEVAVPLRGYSTNEIFEMILEKLEEEDEHAIIILDEFDYFIETGGNDAVYFLVRVYDEYPHYKRRIHYIFILRELSHATNLLNTTTLNYIMKNVIRLDPYTVKQLYDILKYRAELALNPGTISDEALKYIAELTGIDGYGEGNARQALQILTLAGEFADREGTGRITLDHIRKAHALVNPHTVRIQDIIREGSLNFHQLLLLLAIIRVLKSKETEPYAKMGEVEQEYRALCEEFGVKPRGHTQVYEYIRDMKLKGIIDAKISSKGVRGRTTLIGLSAAPLDMLESMLLEMIKNYRVSGDVL